jgi:hypothetical protein
MNRQKTSNSKIKTGLLMLLVILITACSSSQDSLQATQTQLASQVFGAQTAIPMALTQTQQGMQAARTQIADQVFGTQTALASSATITVTPSRTSTPPPASTFTETAPPTSTPAPPTPTLDAQGVERMLLCYKASVIVLADMHAFLKVTGNWGKTLEESLNGGL